MKSKEEAEKEVAKTLNLLNNLPQAEIRPFFYTRLQARLKHRRASKLFGIPNLLQKPAWTLAGLSVLVILNLIVLNSRTSDTKYRWYAQSFASEYQLNTESVYNLNE